MTLGLGALATAPAAGQSFSPVAPPSGLSEVGFRSAPEFADLDGDGDFDLLVGAYDGTFTFFENTGTALAPAFTETALTGLTALARESAPAVGDLDGDGDLDVLSGAYDGSFTFFENTGTALAPSFTAAATPTGLSAVSMASAPSLADLDGDGDLDVLSGGLFGQFSFFENTGTPTAPTFAAAAPLPGLSFGGGYYRSTPFMSDLDGDGDLDVLSGERYGNFFFFENTGTTTSPAFAAPVSVPGLADIGYDSSPTLADLDGDADLDVISGDQEGDFFFFEGQGAALAVGLRDFTALLDHTGEEPLPAALLRWQTVREEDNQGFEVQRLLGDGDTGLGGAYEVLGFVPGAGTTAEERRYTFRTPGLPEGTHRFRLKQLDQYGGASYSPVVTLTVGVAAPFRASGIYPNPFRGEAMLDLAVSVPQQVRVVAYDVLGRTVDVLFDGVLAGGAQEQIAIEGGSWPSGVYVVRIEGDTFRTQRIVTLVP